MIFTSEARMAPTVTQDGEWQGWSDREIARRCGVAHVFVGNVRASLVTVTSDSTQPTQSTRTYTNKDGEVCTMDTSRIEERRR